MILVYLIFFFLILRFTVTLFNFISNPKLTRSALQHDDLISVLVPARNEAFNILTLLQSVKVQNYRNFEVIILDDHSEDKTLEICRKFAESDNRFKVLEGEALEPGWLGKNFACFQLARAASGRYFLFLDADEIVADDLFSNAIHRMKVNKLQLLSLFTNQIMLTTGERLVVPLMHYLVLNLLPLRLVRLSKNPAFSAASGQFMMFESQNYREHQWHAMVKDRIVEDIEIMKLVKGFRFRGEALLANGLIFCRMYRNLSEALAGFSKNLLAGFNNSVLSMSAYVILIISGPFVIAYALNFQLLIFAIGLIILSRIMISLASAQNPWLNVLLHPLQMVMLLVIAVLSLQKYFTKTVTWKGRTIKT